MLKKLDWLDKGLKKYLTKTFKIVRSHPIWRYFPKFKIAIESNRIIKELKLRRKLNRLVGQNAAQHLRAVCVGFWRQNVGQHVGSNIVRNTDFLNSHKLWTLAHVALIWKIFMHTMWVNFLIEVLYCVAVITISGVHIMFLHARASSSEKIAKLRNAFFYINFSYLGEMKLMSNYLRFPFISRKGFDPNSKTDFFTQ